MGWSHTQAAGRVMDKLERICRAQTGMSNTFVVKKEQYFFEIDARDQEDGGISGHVRRLRDGKNMGHFYIPGDYGCGSTIKGGDGLLQILLADNS